MESMTGTIKRITDKGLRLHRRARRRRILLPPVRVHEHANRLDARRRQRDVYARPGPEGPPRRERLIRLAGSTLEPPMTARPSGFECPLSHQNIGDALLHQVGPG